MIIIGMNEQYFARVLHPQGVILYEAKFDRYAYLANFLEAHLEMKVDVAYSCWGDTLLMKLIRD